jgi:hypothetical protein
MTVPHRLFLDANVWFAAAVASTGASAMLLVLCQEGQSNATAARRILQEAEQNLRAKAKPRDAALVRFYRLIVAPGVEVFPLRRVKKPQTTPPLSTQRTLMCWPGRTSQRRMP